MQPRSNKCILLKTTLHNVNDRINNLVYDLLWDKLEALHNWLPTMKKRSEEHSEIGPDITTIKKQMQEVKVWPLCCILQYLKHLQYLNKIFILSWIKSGRNYGFKFDICFDSGSLS